MHWRYRVRRQLVFLRHLFWEAYRERILLSLVSTIVFGSLISIANKVFYGSHFWDKFPHEADISVWFCEYTDMERLVRQPINTFTNFIYLIMGFFFLSKGLEDIKKKRQYNLITANHFYSFVLAIISFYTFSCSTLFHASLVSFASNMDFSAVYSITLFPLMYFTHRVTLALRGKPSNVKHWNERLMMIVIFGAAYVLLTFVISLHYVHPIVAAIIIAVLTFGFYLEKRDPGQTNKDYLIGTSVTIVLAVIFFEFDIKKIWCDPNGVINPHSLWHLFNGASIFFFYLYIRSERYNHEMDALRTTIRTHVHAKLERRQK